MKDNDTQRLNANPILSDRKLTRLGKLLQSHRKKQLEQPQQQLQRQNDEQTPPAVGSSREFLSLFVEGVKKVITADILRAYFASFGEILAVDLSTKSLTDEPGRCAYISILVTGDRSQFLQTEHIVCATRLNIREWYSFDLAETNSIRSAEENNKGNMAFDAVSPSLKFEPNLAETNSVE
ncbi:unnamed protein product [Dibothriocephalus latus]|uniref:RRM domain-containing protein n=1 Tax=Dibothriocephalus latus TaxID=60516 RepID=A0A3P7N285_DIBLA|nr:unnamed protein product [Dibothriocephalus latus]